MSSHAGSPKAAASAALATASWRRVGKKPSTDTLGTPPRADLSPYQEDPRTASAGDEDEEILPPSASAAQTPAAAAAAAQKAAAPAPARVMRRKVNSALTSPLDSSLNSSGRPPFAKGLGSGSPPMRSGSSNSGFTQQHRGKRAGPPLVAPAYAPAHFHRSTDSVISPETSFLDVSVSSREMSAVDADFSSSTTASPHSALHTKSHIKSQQQQQQQPYRSQARGAERPTTTRTSHPFSLSGAAATSTSSPSTADAAAHASTNNKSETPAGTPSRGTKTDYPAAKLRTGVAGGSGKRRGSGNSSCNNNNNSSSTASGSRGAANKTATSSHTAVASRLQLTVDTRGPAPAPHLVEPRGSPALPPPRHSAPTESPAPALHQHKSRATSAEQHLSGKPSASAAVKSSAPSNGAPRAGNSSKHVDATKEPKKMEEQSEKKTAHSDDLAQKEKHGTTPTANNTSSGETGTTVSPLVRWRSGRRLSEGQSLSLSGSGDVKENSAEPDTVPNSTERPGAVSSSAERRRARGASFGSQIGDPSASSSAGTHKVAAKMEDAADSFRDSAETPASVSGRSSGGGGGGGVAGGSSWQTVLEQREHRLQRRASQLPSNATSSGVSPALTPTPHQRGASSVVAAAAAGKPPIPPSSSSPGSTAAAPALAPANAASHDKLTDICTSPSAAPTPVETYGNDLRAAVAATQAQSGPSSDRHTPKSAKPSGESSPARTSGAVAPSQSSTPPPAGSSPPAAGAVSGRSPEYLKSLKEEAAARKLQSLRQRRSSFTGSEKATASLPLCRSLSGGALAATGANSSLAGSSSAPSTTANTSVVDAHTSAGAGTSTHVSSAAPAAQKQPTGSSVGTTTKTQKSVSTPRLATKKAQTGTGSSQGTVKEPKTKAPSRSTDNSNSETDAGDKASQCGGSEASDDSVAAELDTWVLWCRSEPGSPARPPACVPPLDLGALVVPDEDDREFARQYRIPLPTAVGRPSDFFAWVGGLPGIDPGAVAVVTEEEARAQEEEARERAASSQTRHAHGASNSPSAAPASRPRRMSAAERIIGSLAPELVAKTPAECARVQKKARSAATAAVPLSSFTFAQETDAAGATAAAAAKPAPKAARPTPFKSARLAARHSHRAGSKPNAAASSSAAPAAAAAASGSNNTSTTLAIEVKPVRVVAAAKFSPLEAADSLAVPEDSASTAAENEAANNSTADEWAAADDQDASGSDPASAVGGAGVAGRFFTDNSDALDGGRGRERERKQQERWLRVQAILLNCQMSRERKKITADEAAAFQQILDGCQKV